MSRAVIFLSVLLLAHPVFAQQFDIPGASSAVSIAVVPLYPSPNATVTLALKSPLYDLESSQIEWRVDGKVVAGGEGVTSISATVGAAGVSMDVSATLLTEDGEALAFTTITPASVDLLWEAEGYTPGLYKGRTLASTGASLSFVAMPNLVRGGAQVPAKDLIYTWKRNGTVLGSLSGRGKSSLRLENPFLFGADTVTVDVRTSTSDIFATRSINIENLEPTVVLYRDHPLFGTLFNDAITRSYFLTEDEASFVAAPYFAPAVSENDPRLTYEWRVNRQDVSQSKEKPSRITINAQGSDGVALIELLVTHVSNLFYGATASWQVTFSQGRDGTQGASPFDPQ